ncbi:hypothetical protein HMPREF2087_01437 [Helicobacter canis NCTC 12740]|uniref:Uncharacterized protein n=2 Tax=Helicobacter canis TaxID=29419 RepID=V8CE32_9HELI|nr:hypothetical protein HMPREF2087_01437 [Helicobacter canis NCTC 12740]
MQPHNTKGDTMKQRNRFGIEFILSNDDEKSSFESYCRYKGIKLGLLKQDDWNIILPSIVALRNAHKSHIKNRLNNDERFSKFVAKTPPKHLDKAFDTIQSYLSSLQPATKVEIVPAKNTFTKWCESFARQIHLQNTPQTPLESTTQVSKQHTRVVELYQEAIYLYQGIYHLMVLWLRSYIPPSFIESLLKDNQQRIKEIGDELQALEAGFDSKLCQIQESSTALHTLQKETK